MTNSNVRVLDFISIFQSSSNIELFTETACYYFASMLRARFPVSLLMYNPHRVHFAVKIHDTIYDITGIVEDQSEYMKWCDYEEEYEEDAMNVSYQCINLEGR